MVSGDGDAPVDRRQPPDPRPAPQRQPHDPDVQQPDLRADQGPVLADQRRSGRSPSRRRSAASTTRSTRCRWRSGAEATFVARTHDMDRQHMMETLRAGPTSTRAPRSSRSSRTATSSTTARSRTITGKAVRDDMLDPRSRHGEPIRFGGATSTSASSPIPTAGCTRGGGRRGGARTPAASTTSPRRPERRLRAVPPVTGARRSRRRSACSAAVERAEYVSTAGAQLADGRGPEGPGRPAALLRSGRVVGRRAVAFRTPCGRRGDGRSGAVAASAGRAASSPWAWSASTGCPRCRSPRPPCVAAHTLLQLGPLLDVAKARQAAGVGGYRRR